MIPGNVVAELFSAVRENAGPALWSQGVTLTRGSNTFIALSQSAQECIVSVNIQGQSVTRKVTLWPDEQDWDCDCGSANSPCAHVAAAVITLKKGELKSAESSVDSKGSASLAHLEYHFLRSPKGLCFERFLIDPENKKTVFRKPLLGYTTGVRTGRIQGPDILALQADFNIEDVLRGYSQGPLERRRIEGLFRNFEAEQKLFLDEKPVKISSARLLVHFECIDEAEGYRLRRAPIPNFTEMFPHGVMLCGDTLRIVTPTFLNEREKSWFDKEGSYWGPEKEKLLSGTIIPALTKKIAIEVHSIKLPQALELKPRIELLMEKDKDHNNMPCLSVLANIVYGKPTLAQLNPGTMELVNPQGKTSLGRNVVLRDHNEERHLLQKLSKELYLQAGRRVQFLGEEAVEFVKKSRGWDSVGNGASAFNPSERTLTPKVKVSDNNGASFEVDFLVSGSSQSGADFANVFNAWQLGNEDVALMDGSWAKIPKDWMAQFGKKIAAFLASRGDSPQVPAHKVPELATLCEDLGQSYPDSLKTLKTMLSDFRSIPDSPLPPDLTATLRPYQIKGVNWLNFLRKAKLGALLADDMGLGKTLQMLCAIEGKTLIVSPTSVLFNWAEEIKKFRPGLKVAAYYGPQRKFDDSADVTLTSYGVLRMDQEQLSAKDWGSVVLDEAQTIKNPDSQVARAAHSLRADFRATLSGTPIENRLDDLWSQFHFLNPGLLGNRESFLETYARPIEKGEQETARELKRKIKPFILRRLKKEVAPELPPRTEVVLRCELDKEERATYNSIFATTKNEVLKSLEGGGSILKALEVILRLRQACCHRALIPGQQAEDSSKLTLLLESLEESLLEGHKSLIFSQWTSLLDIIQRELTKKNIPLSRIDGSTQKRQDIVSEFQLKDGPPIMLISLKAGGVGLTLTAADHVYIMDPWWNPAVEDQAADRAHRIGQTNPVMIHRLVALNSIEEKILLLQEKKKDLAKAVLDEGQAALGLTRQDLMDLLS